MIFSGRSQSGQRLQVEFVEIKAAGNQSGLQKQTLQASPPRPGVGMVPLDRAEGALGLNGAVHAQQSAVYAVEVGKNLLVEAGQLFVQMDDTVSRRLGALILMGAAGTKLYPRKRTAS